MVDLAFSRFSWFRGSNGYTAEEHVKLMKLMWDAISTEFGGRHELYERNYFGSHESIPVRGGDDVRPPQA